MVDEDYFGILTGALFHDIGKFWQRAEKNNETLNRDIKAEFNLKISGMPNHEFWSAYLLKNFLNEDEAARIAKNHHAPSNHYDCLVAIADKLSGDEREYREKGEKCEPSTEPLISIFSQVEKIKRNFNFNSQGDLQEIDNRVPTLYLPLTGKELKEETFFPVEKKEDAFKVNSYKKLWEDFEESIKKINLSTSNFKKILQLYHVLEVFTTSITSAAYYSVADISLFDHLKTTTAIAACLYQYSQKRGMPDFQNIHNNLVKKYNNQENEFEILETEAFTLLSGDISGIQGFIYNISSEGAAKSLKGRSIYMSLLPEIIAKYIVRKLSLTYANILYCGGGHFYLLLPYLEENEINEIQKTINEILFDAHNGTFSIVIAGIPLSFNDFSGKVLIDKWEQVGKILYDKKKSKFIEIIKKNPEKFFGPISFPEKLCFQTKKNVLFVKVLKNWVKI